MPATAMNHFTILTDDVDATIEFYGELLGLAPGPRPPFDFPGAWLYARRTADPARHRRPAARRAARPASSTTWPSPRPGSLTTLAKLDARGIALRLPAAAGAGHLAALLPRPQRRARRARFRSRRDAVTVTLGRARRPRNSITSSSPRPRSPTASTTSPQRTGVAPQPGGKHVAMGTHNALLRLGERVYLEIIAIDPEARSRRARAGSTSTTSRCRRSSPSGRGSIHWVARTDRHRARGGGVPDSRSARSTR